MYVRHSIAVLALLQAFACNDFEASPQAVTGRANSFSPAEGAPTADQVDASQSSEIATTEVAVEPTPVAGSFLTCSMNSTLKAPQGIYPVYCQIPMEDGTNWSFAYSRNGATPEATVPTQVEGSPNLWLLRISILPSDTSLRVDAKLAMQSVESAEAPKTYALMLLEADLKPFKDANVTSPINIVVDQAAVLTTTIGGLQAYFTAGPLVEDGNNELTVQTLMVTPSITPEKAPYELRLRKSDNGTYQMVTRKPKATADTCLDMRGFPIALGVQLISYPCKSISLLQNQAFLTIMQADAKSFKIQSSAQRGLCVGLKGPTNDLVVVDCAAAPVFQLSLLP